MSEHQKNMIEKRAYDLYLSRNCQHGNDLDDWLTAEREILGRSDSKTKERTRRGKK